ncbi:MAG TPA: hypothetical protein VFS52_00810, partial [Steroidobacteraceae bacterium]|nr:hypothetical protein [Steroidobacteraceae bacterium]
MKGRYLWGVVAAIAFAASDPTIAGISGGAFARSTDAPLVLLGPVEAINQREGVVVVLGQRLPARVVGHVEVGQTVAVFGTFDSRGVINVLGVQRQGLYVPGATSIVLTGVVQKVVPALGRATVGGVNVDLVSLVPLEQSEGIAVGSLVQVAGIQPVAGGLILVQGISGGATSGISGGATSGISGGATSGISGGATS